MTRKDFILWCSVAMFVIGAVSLSVLLVTGWPPGVVGDVTRMAGTVVIAVHWGGVWLYERRRSQRHREALAALMKFMADARPDCTITVEDNSGMFAASYANSDDTAT